MTVLAVAGIIAGTGLAEIGGAALTVITDITLAVGSLTMLVFFLYLLALVFWRLRKRREPLTVVIAPPVYQQAECPWCDTRECLDSTLCDCETPCGSWLCVVKEANHG